MNSQSATVLKVINSIKSLKKLNETDFESDQCLDYLKKIDNSYNEDKSSRMDIAKAMVETNYPDAALKCLKYYTRKNFFDNEQTWPCCFYLLRSIWNYSDVYSEVALASVGFLPILLDLISNEYLLASDEEDEKLYKLALNIMNNIAHLPETKVAFQQCQASKILKNLSNIENEHLKVLVYLILAQIVYENEYDKLNDPTSDVIDSIANYIKESLKKDHRYKGITTAEYMDCMARLAVTKENKIKIIESGMLTVFKTILSNSNISDEQNNTLTCIWNLCFDDKIAETLRKDKDLMPMVTNFKNSSPSEEMQRRSAGILFTMNDLQKKGPAKSADNSRKSNDPTSLDKNKSHIMISYNCGSREMCLKIKDELKAKGYQVWIDVEQIYGSSLATMAEAVENASVFLMCVTEKYYLSPNCRLEAEYAVRLQKPIIPLIMQQDYMPLGWLGIIIGGKIYYKFTGGKQAFDYQTFSNMTKEINRYIDDAPIAKPIKPRPPNCSSLLNNKNLSSDNGSASASSFSTSSSSNDTMKPNSIKTVISNKPVLEWSNREVKQWIMSLGLSSWILESDIFENINGHMLKELNEMKKSAPEFFYNLMKSKLTNTTSKTSSNENFHLHDLLKLSSELNELFKLK